ncbi:B3/B4 domain-containing protein [Anaerococcus rubeinfantis]|uniref:B3/B4 domain-containing protein n=1 Tax=Anaerococcus rubeinfantis TaxID=1720199 RepID=UPI00073F0F61|nr:B3/4 domain-containing protein [Anaerococcus rubeinfantis]
MKFIASESFWELFPEAEIGLILFKDIKMEEKSNREIKDKLDEAHDKALTYLTKPVLSENPVIKVWRDAFKLFKTKKGARSSIEALLKRVSKDQDVGSINPLVDIYNTTSLNYALPCGAEDIDKFVGDLRLEITQGGDDFQPIGDDKNSPTLEGELCYKDDEGAICRCFNWRDGQRTMITEDTKNAILFMENIDPERKEDLKEAINYLAENLENHLEGKVEIHFLTKDNASVEIK